MSRVCDVTMGFYSINTKCVGEGDSLMPWNISTVFTGTECDTENLTISVEFLDRTAQASLDGYAVEHGPSTQVRFTHGFGQK